MARCGECGHDQAAARFCGHCGALTGRASRERRSRGPARSRPSPPAGPSDGSPPGSGASLDGGTEVRRLATAAVALVVVATIVALSWSGAANDGSVADEPGGGSGTDDVALPEQGEVPDEPSSQEAAGDDAVAGGGTDGTSTGFECLLESGCGWEVDVDELGEVAAWDIRAVDVGSLLVPGDEAIGLLEPGGRWRWIHRAGGGVRTAEVAVAGELVLATVGDRRDRLLGFELGTGARRWSVSSPEETDLSSRAVASSDGDVVLAVFEERIGAGRVPTNATVRAHDPTHGRLRWEEQAAQVLLGEETVVLVDGGDVRGVDAATGEQRWRREVERPELDERRIQLGLSGSPFLLAGEEVILLTGQVEGTRLIDVGTGEDVASFRGEASWVREPGEAGDGAVLAVRDGREGTLTGIGADGQELWQESLVIDDECCADVRASERGVLLAKPGAGRFRLLEPTGGSVVLDWSVSEDRRESWYPVTSNTVTRMDVTEPSMTARHAIYRNDLWRISGVRSAHVVPGSLLMVDDGRLSVIPDDLGGGPVMIGPSTD